MDKLQTIIEKQKTFEEDCTTISISDARNAAIEYLQLFMQEIVNTSNADITLQEGKRGNEYYIVNNIQNAQDETMAFTRVRLQDIAENFD